MGTGGYTPDHTSHTLRVAAEPSDEQTAAIDEDFAQCAMHHPVEASFSESS